MDPNEKQAAEMEEAYRHTVEFTHPELWRTTITVFTGLAAEYPAATEIMSVPALRKDGSVTQNHYPVDANGVVCGPPVNDSNPKPPLPC